MFFALPAPLRPAWSHLGAQGPRVARTARHRPSSAPLCRLELSARWVLPGDAGPCPGHLGWSRWGLLACGGRGPGALLSPHRTLGGPAEKDSPWPRWGGGTLYTLDIRVDPQGLGTAQVTLVSVSHPLSPTRCVFKLRVGLELGRSRAACSRRPQCAPLNVCGSQNLCSRMTVEGSDLGGRLNPQTRVSPGADLPRRGHGPVWGPLW